VDIYLHVRLTVRKDRDTMAKFERAVNAFLDAGLLQKEFGWSLVAGMQVVEQNFPSEPLRRPLVASHGDENTFINIWRLPNNQSVAEIPDIMLRLSEDPTYVDLDSAVLDESQDVVYRVNQALDEQALQPTADEKAVAIALRQRKRIAFVRHYVDRDKLAEYVVNFAALAPKWAAETHGLYAGTYQNITGLLNEFWDVWGLYDEGNLQSVRDTFRNLIDNEVGDIVKLYKHSIDYDKRDPRVNYKADSKAEAKTATDDGLVVAVPAFYWNPS
jgi:hypothetical protein